MQLLLTIDNCYWQCVELIMTLGTVVYTILSLNNKTHMTSFR